MDQPSNSDFHYERVAHPSQDVQAHQSGFDSHDDDHDDDDDDDGHDDYDDDGDKDGTPSFCY